MNSYKKTTLALALFVALTQPLSAKVSNQIYPVTPGVLESINEITTLSKDTEMQLLSTTQRLNAQLETFKVTGCEGAGKQEESNCMAQFKQIKGSFVDLLDGMSQSMPDIQTKVRSVTAKMQGNINKYASQKTLKDLYSDVNSNPEVKKQKIRRMGLSRYLADITSKLNRFTNNSMLQTGLEIYDDFKGVDKQITQLQDLISYHKANMAYPDEYLYGNAEQFGEVLGVSMDILYGDESAQPLDDTDVLAQNRQKKWFE